MKEVELSSTGPSDQDVVGDDTDEIQWPGTSVLVVFLPKHQWLRLKTMMPTVFQESKGYCIWKHLSYGNRGIVDIMLRWWIWMSSARIPPNFPALASLHQDNTLLSWLQIGASWLQFLWPPLPTRENHFYEMMRFWLRFVQLRLRTANIRNRWSGGEAPTRTRSASHLELNLREPSREAPTYSPETITFHHCSLYTFHHVFCFKTKPKLLSYI